MSDLAERLDALKAQNRQTSDSEAKKLYLEGLERGMTKGQASRNAGRTGRWFRARCNPEAHNYDPEFAQACEAAFQASRAAIVEDVFSALVEAAKGGNVRAQEKVLATYAEDFGWLRTQNAQGALNVEQLQVFFGELPLSKLLELKEARQAAKQKELPVIDQ